MLENAETEPIAFISDLHANLEAAQTVFNHIKKQGIKKIICLGDIVGYGPDPELVVDLVRKNCTFVIMGNHDWGLVRKPYGFSPVAKKVIEYTQECMRPKSFNVFGQKKKRWEYIENLPKRYDEDGVTLVHGSVRDTISEYVYPDRMRGYDPYTLEDLFLDIEHLCFCGHTHHPCVIKEDTSCWYPDQDEGKFVFLSNSKYIINVGSVGQPRDGDSRSCYAVYSEKEIQFHRVEYDVEKTANKLMSKGFDPKLAVRLRNSK